VACAQDAVSLFLAEVADVTAGALEDPQFQEPKHGDQWEVARTR
jgi:hypothetical protein